MLAKRLDNEEVNQLPAVLQEPAMASDLKVLWFVGGLFVWSFVVVILFLNLVIYL